MSAEVAKKDITIVDGAGRTVVVVAAGQPIPDDLDAKKKLYGQVTRTASEEEIAEARGEAPPKKSAKK